MLVAQEVTGFGRQFREQAQGMFIISYIGDREVSRQRDPDGSYGGDQVQFPTVDPPMPARLGPMGFGVDGAMRHNAGFAVFLCHTPPLALSTVLSMAAARPQLAHGCSMLTNTPSKATDLRRQRRRQCLQTAFPGPPRRKAAVDRQ